MGPLAGLKIVELFCIGPGPFAGMLLSDMGADVILVDREVEQDLGYPDHPYRFVYRNRRSVRADLKTPEGVEAVRRFTQEQQTGAMRQRRHELRPARLPLRQLAEARVETHLELAAELVGVAGIPASVVARVV